MRFQTKKASHLKGQAVLIVLLSLSVVLIVVLFIMSRSVTDISLSTKEEDSLRAFSAAEAGVERALVVGSGSSGSVDSANFSATVSSFAQGSDSVVFPISLKSGDSATFWLSRTGEATSFTGSQIKYCWGDLNSTTAVPALEITIYYTSAASPNDLSTLRVARATLDPDASRRANNNFGVPINTNCTIGTDTFEYQGTLNLASLGISGYATSGVLKYTTAKILYNTVDAHKIGIDVTETGSTLPSQGNEIVSDGSFGNSNRKVQVYELHPEVPPVFANAIFSASGIVK